MDNTLSRPCLDWSEATCRLEMRIFHLLKMAELRLTVPQFLFTAYDDMSLLQQTPMMKKIFGGRESTSDMSHELYACLLLRRSYVSSEWPHSQAKTSLENMLCSFYVDLNFFSSSSSSPLGGS